MEKETQWLKTTYCFSQLCDLAEWLFLPEITRVAVFGWQVCWGLGSAGTVDRGLLLPPQGLGLSHSIMVSRHFSKKKHCQNVKTEATRLLKAQTLKPYSVTSAAVYRLKQITGPLGSRERKPTPLGKRNTKAPHKRHARWEILLQPSLEIIRQI